MSEPSEQLVTNEFDGDCARNTPEYPGNGVFHENLRRIGSAVARARARARLWARPGRGPQRLPGLTGQHAAHRDGYAENQQHPAGQTP